MEIMYVLKLFPKLVGLPNQSKNAKQFSVIFDHYNNCGNIITKHILL